ncbi:hypothetical protein QTG56_03655 [Rossellomorea sp. AcN35-11]|nr:hypothetical protein QTG56_03655 [Rossellomorea sp. AcN35-11]
MAQFYVNQNQQSNGEHEVHMEGCDFMPFEKKSIGTWRSLKLLKCDSKSKGNV